MKYKHDHKRLHLTQKTHQIQTMPPAFDAANCAQRQPFMRIKDTLGSMSNVSPYS